MTELVINPNFTEELKKLDIDFRVTKDDIVELYAESIRNHLQTLLDEKLAVVKSIEDKMEIRKRAFIESLNLKDKMEAVKSIYSEEPNIYLEQIGNNLFVCLTLRKNCNSYGRAIGDHEFHGSMDLKILIDPDHQYIQDDKADQSEVFKIRQEIREIESEIQKTRGSAKTLKRKIVRMVLESTEEGQNIINKMNTIGRKSIL